MTPTPDPKEKDADSAYTAPQPELSPHSTSRLRLVLDLLIFQLKLGVDGTRDLILIPISLVAGVWGILFGGTDPARPFNKVLQLGRLSERWINLFGHPHRSGTADDVLEPLQEKLLEQAHNTKWVQAADARMRPYEDGHEASGKTPD